MKQVYSILLILFSLTSDAQVNKDSDLFLEFKKQDSIFFERGFNLCDLAYLESRISDNLKFYHDQSGFQDRKAFFENTEKYICSDSEQKPIRKVDANSLVVFPLYNNGSLYGVIQKGIHHFYLREKGKEDIWTSTAKFTTVWVLEDKIWKISEVLSYDHQDPMIESPQSGIEILPTTQDVRFESEGVSLAGTIYQPKNPHAAVVLVHGSDQVPRMSKFAEHLAKEGISVLTYDKRGVGESGGVYAGPEVGTNNISKANITLLAKDANAAVNLLQGKNKKLPIGLVGFSQAGWIIPMAANKNSLVEFMVLFSCPTISTLEQLRFQFYTNGETDFWEHHTEVDARYHIENDEDRYEFEATDPKDALSKLTIPGLWLFGEKDIQIPVKMCVEQLNTLKVQGKAFEYSLFTGLGHNTASANSTAPVDIATQWIKQRALDVNSLPISRH